MANVATVLAEAFSHGHVTTIPDVARALDCFQEADPFATAECVGRRLSDFGLAIRPGVESGEYEQERVVYPTVRGQSIEDQIAKGESAECEFKATFLYPIDQARKEPDKHSRELDHDVCILSVLKSVAGFLNRRGGTLLIGVSDNGEITGIERDLACLRRAQTHDQWELMLQSTISSRLTNGKQILSRLDISIVQCGEAKVCRIVVPESKEEVFVRDKTGRMRLYVRSGNRTDELQIEDVPAFVRERMKP